MSILSALMGGNGGNKEDVILYAPEYMDLLERYFLMGNKSGGGCLGDKKLITDKEYYNMVMQRKAQIRPYERALGYLGIDDSSVQEIPPVEFEGFVRGVKSIMDRSVDTSAGLEYIRGEEAGDVAEIETKISLLEQQEYGENDQRSIKEKFSGSVVIGDSIPEGFSGYDVLNSSNVVAKKGARLGQLSGQIESAKALSPAFVFISIGENDIENTDRNLETFISRYSDLLDTIRQEMPDASVFVNSVFPVQQKAIDANSQLGEIPTYNEELRDLCDSKGIGFIDNSGIVQDEYYEPDGQHFKADFYAVWAEPMAEGAQL